MVEQQTKGSAASPLLASAPSIAALVAGLLAIPLGNLFGAWLREARIDIEPTLATVEDDSNWRNEPITPVLAPKDLNLEEVSLGRTLFHEPGLSSTGSIACASCHKVDEGGDDGRSVSKGVGGLQGEMNSPTVLNAALNFRQFWDGRAGSLEEQVEGPLHNPVEMGSDWNQVVAFLKESPAYRKWFNRIYADGVTQKNIASAIAEYERSLVTTDAPFDRWLKGNDDALNDLEKHGYDLFKKYGCVGCHQGENIGGNVFQPLGVMVGYFESTEKHNRHLGRFNVTKDLRDLHVFKVPGLRNVAKTAPYFHDGSAATLDTAIRTMFEHQLGMPIKEDELRAIRAFLTSLSATPIGEGA